MSKFFLGLVATFIALLLWSKEPEWKELAGFWLFVGILTIATYQCLHWLYLTIRNF